MPSKRFSAPKQIDTKSEVLTRIKSHLENPKTNPTNGDLYTLLLDIASVLEKSAK